ncbi:MAG: DNA polymerase III subunit epsilon, partial [Burkholderiales bacterium PBB4]
MTQNQLDFAFVAELPILDASPPKRRGRSKAAQAATPPVQSVLQPTTTTSIADTSDIEAMARALEAHPDFRVMRRLVPRLDWPNATALRQCTVVILDTETTGLDASKEKIIELALL